VCADRDRDNRKHSEQHDHTDANFIDPDIVIDSANLIVDDILIVDDANLIDNDIRIVDDANLIDNDIRIVDDVVIAHSEIGTGPSVPRGPGVRRDDPEHLQSE
jgi:hypothetical protein